MSNTTNLQVTYRNVADIASAMQKFQEEAMPSIGEYQQILTNIKNSKLDGLTNINIRNYFADVHYLINDTILTTFDAITSIITLYAYDLEKYDGSKDFIVIQSELEKKYPKYQHISDTFSSNYVIIKSAYDSISEYIDEGLLDVSNITSRLEDMRVFFETMYQQIYDEGSSYGDKLIEINELLTNLQKIIDKAMEIKITEYDFSQLSKIEGINELNDSLFNIKSFLSNESMMENLDEAAYSLEAYKRLKDAEAKRKSLIIDIAIAVAVAVGSVAVVAATGGLAVGIIATGLAVTSAVDVGFKVSEVVENESVIHKSRENDMSPGFNPIRDKLFNENQEAYDKIKSLNSTALGFFQFATIFVGGVGLIDGWKSASTVAQKGLAVLKAGGRASLKIGREYAENYVEDKVAGFLSSISSYVLMQQGYSKEAAKRLGDKRSNAIMSLYGLGGSVKGAVGGVQKYKQAKRDRAVVGDKEIIGKANSIRRNDDIEITPRKKYDTSNCEDLRNRLANTKNDSNPKNKVNKPKTDVDGKTNKNDVNHNQPDITATTNKENNTKHKHVIKHDQQQVVENKIGKDVENIGIDDQASIIVEKYLHDNNIDHSESDTISKYFKSFDLNKYKGADHKIYLNGEHIYRKKHNKKALKPNGAYCTGLYKNQFYLTDEMGRIADTIEIGTRNKYTDKNLDEKFKNRENHYRNPEGKIKGVDDAGHLNADKNGGSSDVDNIVSQNSALNKKEYKNMEKCINKLIDRGHIVNKRIRVEYDGSNMRPGKFNIELNVDDKVYYFSFLNCE